MCLQRILDTKTATDKRYNTMTLTQNSLNKKILILNKMVKATIANTTDAKIVANKR